MKYLRIIAIVPLLVMGVGAQAQTPTAIPGAYPTTPPTGYTGQAFYYNCATACWPLVEIWNGAKRVNVTVGGALQTDSSAAPQPVTSAAGSVASGAFVSGAIVDLFSSSPPAAYAGTGAASLITEAEAIRVNTAVGVTNVGPSAAPAKAVVTGGMYNTPAISLTNGQSAAIQLAADGSQKVNITGSSGPIGVTAASGAYAVGSMGDLYSATPPTPYGGTGAATTIAMLEAIRRSVGAVAASNATCNGFAPATLGTSPVCKNTAGTVYDIQVGNSGAIGVYFKIYDNASAVTCGASAGTPIGDYPIPANSISSNLGGNNIIFPTGKSFANGLTWCVTQNAAYNDAVAPASGVINVNVDFQ